MTSFEQWDFEAVQQALMAVLTSHAASNKISYADVARNLSEYTGQTWEEWRVGRIRRGEERLKPEQFEPFIWAHEMAPYAALRAIERSNADAEDIKQITPANMSQFHASSIPVLRGVPQVQCGFLNSIPDTSHYDITLVSLLPRQSTGPRHRRRNYWEIVIPIDGDIEITFTPLNESVRTEIVKPGQMLGYNASLPHTAREATQPPQPTRLYLISVPGA